MDKVRVYELARDIGVTSPDTIRLLKDKLQIRVKSASSTIEEEVAIKLKRLIRLEGMGAVSSRRAKEEGKEATAAGNGEELARTTSKRRAERARLAILAEMEEEERAEARRKAAEERAAKKREEAERLAAEQAVREEAARVAAVLEEQETLQTQLDAQARAEAILDGGAPELALGGAGRGELAEALPATVATEHRTGEREDATRPALPPVAHPGAAAGGPQASSRIAASAPNATSAAGERTERPRLSPGRPAFVPGPTSTVIRPRIPGASRSPGTMKPIPPPPRPAAPIKTVTRRRPDAKPRAKGPGRKTRPTAAEIKEQAIPEPKLGEASKAAVPKVFRKISLTEGVTVKELAEKM